MSQSPSRRIFVLSGVAASAVFGLDAERLLNPRGKVGAPETGDLDHFPKQHPTVVAECVGAAHGRFEVLRNLVDQHPALAAASHDWGFGDWETPLGAASHVGNREIAEYLLSKGARPNIFSATMLGQLDVVKAFVTAMPGIQATTGPHGITLFNHARAGGERAREVKEYLEAVGNANPAPPVVTLTAAELERYVGTYSFGLGASERLEASIANGNLQIKRVGGGNRTLFHVGDHAFRPAGAAAVRIRFSNEEDAAQSVTVIDHDVLLTARRAAARADIW